MLAISAVERRRAWLADPAWGRAGKQAFMLGEATAWFEARAAELRRAKPGRLIPIALV
jgi:hypothetical protein